MKLCLDCNSEISSNLDRVVRCRECQLAYRKQKNLEYIKKHHEKYKLMAREQYQMRENKVVKLCKKCMKEQIPSSKQYCDPCKEKTRLKLQTEYKLKNSKRLSEVASMCAKVKRIERAIGMED